MLRTLVERSTPRLERKLIADAAGGSDVGALVWAVKTLPAMVREPYPPRSVHSLYYDTEDLAFFREHANGLAERCKLRARWYGRPGERPMQALARATNVVLELKTRSGDVGGKLLVPLRETPRSLDALARAKDFAPCPMPVLLPECIVSYDRRYFACGTSDLRLTIDYRLRCSSFGGDERGVPLGEGAVIELKAKPEHGLALADLAAALGLPPSKNSKYLRAQRVLKRFL